MPVAVEDSCRRLIAYVDVYTGASLFYAGLVHYECIDERWIARLDLYRMEDC
jgi:hypothetical protein